MNVPSNVSDAPPLRVIVCGIGGIGGPLAEGLVRMLEYKRPGSLLLLIDGDHYEPKNAERQMFASFGNKASVKAAELQGRFPLTYVIPLPKWVVPEIKSQDPETESKITASSLLQEGDVVFAVVDNYACRALLLDTCKSIDNIDCFIGGNDEALYGSIYHYQRRDGADITDHPAEFHPEFINPPDRNPGQLSCQERAEIQGGTQFIATNFSVAAYLLGRMQHTIFDGNIPEATESQWDLGLGFGQAYDRRVVGQEAAEQTTGDKGEVALVVGG